MAIMRTLILLFFTTCAAATLDERLQEHQEAFKALEKERAHIKVKVSEDKYDTTTITTYTYFFYTNAAKEAFNNYKKAFARLSNKCLTNACIEGLIGGITAAIINAHYNEPRILLAIMCLELLHKIYHHHTQRPERYFNIYYLTEQDNFFKVFQEYTLAQVTAEFLSTRVSYELGRKMASIFTMVPLKVF